MSTPPTPHDLILYVALVDDNLKELTPSIYRRFRVSAHVNLDLLHDKILIPIMGWTRNYHTYSMRKLKGNSTTYIQMDTNAMDTMHVLTSDSVQPESVTIGELLESAGDRLLYVYDMGDSWHHLMTLEEVIVKEANGAVQVLSGAMRCPDEDGEGCGAYQSQVLNLYIAAQADPWDHIKARKLADACIERSNALNVRGPFHPGEWSIEKCQSDVDADLRSRNWARNSVKLFGPRGPPPTARIGQQFIATKYEDTRGCGGRQPFQDDPNLFRTTMGETINLKPDEVTLCSCCDNPLSLRKCTGCKCIQYCSVSCQKAEWKLHKKVCKIEKKLIEKYNAELASNTPDPNRFIDGGKTCLRKYDPENLRMKIGDRVEALVDHGVYATGTIVALLYTEPVWPWNEPAPYQILLDREHAYKIGRPPEDAFIYSVWDDDHQVRLLPAAGDCKKCRDMMNSSD